MHNAWLMPKLVHVSPAKRLLGLALKLICHCIACFWWIQGKCSMICYKYNKYIGISMGDLSLFGQDLG